MKGLEVGLKDNQHVKVHSPVSPIICALSPQARQPLGLAQGWLRG